MANLRPPVSLEALMDEWSNDAPMDETDPQKSMAQIPNLHAKYLRILTHHSMVSKKIMRDYNNRRRIKMEWYAGDLNNTEDLEKYGLEPYMKKLMRSEIPHYLDSDEELNNILLKKVVHDEIVEFCKSVLKELNQRTWQIRSYMDWQRFIGT